MPDAPAGLREALSDRYDIRREIGHGGMATVYLANERKHAREVAIKALHPELGASLGAERFLREIDIVARLNHPHIVSLIDSGNAAGTLYYVSPYVAGGSLRERLAREGRLPLDDVLAIAQELASALDFAHRSGFVHRDVKPENILFAEGEAMLADFGVARAAGSTAPDTVTAGGVALGTPAYMSPEQAAADSDIGAASDVYSLACVVYEMLSGVPPLLGSTGRATLVKQVTETPRPIRLLRPELPESVESALARALSKSPSERFATVMDFVAALRNAGSTTRRPRFTQRSIAVLPFVNASGDPGNEYLSDGITDEIISALAKVEGLRVPARTSVFALKGKPLDVRAIGALLGVTEVLEGTVRRSGDRLRITAQLTSTQDGQLVWSERYDRTLRDVFEIQDEIARTIVTTLRGTFLAELSPPVARRYTDNVTAYGLYLRGRFAWNKRSQEGVTEAIEYFERAIAEDPGYALAYTGLADAYALHVDYRSVPVHEGFDRAKSYARQALALDDSLAEAHASLAWSLFVYDWDWEGARRSFQRAIELAPHYATAHQWYAFLLASQGSLDEALVEGHTALESDPASVSVRRTLGWLYFYTRRYAQSHYHLVRAIAMNPTAEETYRTLGLMLALDGQLPESERVLREAVTMPGAGSYTRATLGYTLARSGKREEAESLLADLAERRSREYVSPVALATLHIGLGNIDDALSWCEAAHEARRGWLAYFKVNPLLDPLRGEPRFQALVKKMSL